MNPVLACGSSFEVTRDPNNAAGVQVVALTFDPHKTAQEIGERLLLRLEVMRPAFDELDCIW
jgi:hypothetical protein